ncbi:MAG: four helix bundle protein [Bacteroides sp.]|nr:four helix bundle protein [Bacillota bacterium]MCM1394334.1 four helix bundle protein [[Eubacterium] siraeum]MCM1456110.1 four helix bundle protein [Bacteroides sp.]
MKDNEKKEQQDAQLEAISREIAREAKTDAPEPPDFYEKEGKAGRAPFRIRDFDAPRDKDMAVLTHAKKLSEYLFVITEKSPVKYRWNIVSRLLNTSTDIIEFLYQANFEKGERRLDWQKKALVYLNMLDFYTETAKTKQAINFHQMNVIALQIYEVKKLLNGWIRSDKAKPSAVSGA